MPKDSFSLKYSNLFISKLINLALILIIKKIPFFTCQHLKSKFLILHCNQLKNKKKKDFFILKFFFILN
jgi:hypothetical protein